MFKELTVTHALSSKKTCEFVVVGDSGQAPYKYGDTVVIPYFEGVLFSGVVINTKKIQAYNITDAPQLFWKISCVDDFGYLERSICKNVTTYENVTPPTLLKAILGESWWFPKELTGGTYDSISDLGNKLTITYNPNNQSKSEAVVNVLSQTGYEWRIRRPTYKTRVTNFTQSGTTGRIRFSPSLDQEYLDKYVITTQSNDEVPIYSQVIMISGAGQYDCVCRISQVEDEGDFELVNCPADMQSKVAIGDEFIITLHPILEASPVLDNVLDREFTTNEDIFQFDVQEDESSVFNAVTVRTQTYDGEAYTSYLPAVYNINNQEFVWNDCAYISGDKIDEHGTILEYAYPDAYVSTAAVDGTVMKVFVVDQDNSTYRFAPQEFVSFGGRYSYEIIQVVLDNQGNTVLHFRNSDFNNEVPRPSMPILRAKIHVDGTYRLNLRSTDSIAIGNEVYSPTQYTIDSTNNLIILDNGGSANLYKIRKSPHMAGTVVRNAGRASDTSPQYFSPVGKMGFLKIKAMNANSGSDPALADRIATTALASGCVSEKTGKGTIIYTDFYKTISSGELTNQPLEVGDVIRVWYGSVINPDGTPNPSGLVSEDFRITDISFALDTGKVDIRFGNSLETIGDHLVSINTTIGRV